MKQFFMYKILILFLALPGIAFAQTRSFSATEGDDVVLPGLPNVEGTYGLPSFLSWNGTAFVGNVGSNVGLHSWSVQYRPDGGLESYMYELRVNENQAPEFDSSPNTSAKEGSSYSYSISVSDPDAGDPDLRLVSGPSWLSLSGTTLSGTPGYNHSGNHSVRLRATDRNPVNPKSTDQTFTINVANTNRAPSISSSPVTNAKEGADYEYNISASDPDGDNLSYSLREGPGWLSLSGSRLYGTPGYDQAGSHSIEIRVSDGNGGTDTQSFTIDVENTNRPPEITSSGDRTVDEGDHYSYDVAVSDPDGDELTFLLVEGPGWLSFSDNRLEGTPGYDQAGSHSIEIRVSDGNGGTDTQSFTLTVRNTNLPPEITSVPVVEGEEGAAYRYDVVVSDPDGDSVVISVGSLPGWLSFSDNGDGTATLEGTPGYSDSGSYPIELTASDGGLTDRQEFTLTVENVNLAPEFTSTPVEEGKEAEAYTYQITTSDLEGDEVTVSAEGLPEWLSLTNVDPASGTATLEGTPGYEDEGSYNIELTASDGELSQVQSFTLIIEHTNAAPGFTSTPVEEGKETEAYTYQITTSDIDSFNNLMVSLVEGPGWLSLTNVDPASGTATLEGTPGYSDSGSYDIELLVEDDGDPVKSDTQIFSLYVENTNRAPEITSTEVVAVEEGRLYSYLIEAVDPDGEGVSFVGEEIPHWATFVDNGDGTATLEGTPGYSDGGVYSVEIQVEDSNSDNPLTDTQTFSIAVADINGYPEFTSTPVEEGKEAEAYTYQITTSDPDGDNVTVSVQEGPGWLSLTNVDPASGTATLEGTPGYEDEGRHRVELRGTDSGNPTLNVSQVFYVTVENTNRPPEFISDEVVEIEEGSAYFYRIEARDLDLNEVVISGDEIPHWATFVDNGDGTATLEGTPGFQDNGEYQVVLAAGDGEFTVAQEFTITVIDVNDAPVITSENPGSVAEAEDYLYEIKTSDADGDDVTVSVGSIPGWLSFSDNGDGTATLEGTPGYSDSGSYPIELTASDGELEDVQEFTLTVENTNRSPGITSGPVTIAKETERYTYQITTSDPDDEEVTVSAEGLPGWLSIEGVNPSTGTARLEGTPGLDDQGEAEILIIATDEQGAQVTQEFTITVENTNQAPGFTSTPVEEGKETEAYTYQITTSDPDDGDEVTVSAEGLPEWLSLTNVDPASGTATLEGTPGYEDEGSYDIELAATDNGNPALFQLQNFTIDVENTNRAPEIISQAVKVVGANLDYVYQIEASDPDGDTVTVSAEGLPEWLSLTNVDPASGTATLEGTPGFDDSGIFPIQIIVEDNGSPVLRGGQNFDIVVSYTNRQPEFTSVPVVEGEETQEYSYHIQVEDVDNDEVTVSAEGLPGWLSLTNVDPASGTATLEGTPGFDDSGSYPIELTATDNGNPALFQLQNFTIDVENTNRAPEFTSVPVVEGKENELYIYLIEVQELDSQDDIEITISGRPEWATFVDNGDGTATLEGTPGFQDNGNYNIELTASDGELEDVQEFTLTVENVNDAPVITSENPGSVAEAEDYLYEIKTSDADGDDVTVSVGSIPGWLSFSDNGDGTATLEGTPGYSDSGSYPIELTASDGELEDVQEFTVEVFDVNRAPEFTSVPVKNATEGLGYEYNISASDPDGDTVTFTVNRYPHWATFVDNGDGTATLEGTPGWVDSGIYSVSITAIDDGDGELSQEQTYSIVVANTNNPPFFTSGPVLEVTETSEYQYNIQTEDTDGNNVTVSAEELPEWLSLTNVDPASGTATLEGTPGYEDEGKHSIILVAVDNGNPVLGAMQRFTLEVINKNQKPVFTSSEEEEGKETERYTYQITTSDPDDGDEVTVSAEGLPEWLSLTNVDPASGTATLEGTPGYSDSGSYPIELTASDGELEDVQEFTLRVFETNKAPVIQSSPVAFVQAENRYEYIIQATDSIDVVEDEVSFSATLSDGSPLPDFLSLRDVTSPEGEFHVALVGTPAASDVGDYEVKLTASDGELEDVQEFTFSVTGENRPPEFTSTPMLTVNVDSLYQYQIRAIDADENNVTVSLVEGPGWLSLSAVDSVNGTATLQGTPGFQDNGEHSVTLVATDHGRPAKTDRQEFTVSVGKNNYKPVFVSVPPNQKAKGEKEVSVIAEEIEYRYVVAAVDTADGIEEELKISVEAVEGADLPGFLKLQDVDGSGIKGVYKKELIGTPKSGEKGRYEYIVRVEDEGGLVERQHVVLEVEQGNRQPRFISDPVTEVRIDQSYHYEVKAEDPDGDGLTYKLSMKDGRDLPEWLSFSVTDSSAIISGQPEEDDIGQYHLEIIASDDGLPQKQRVQEFNLEVQYKPVTELKILYNYPNPFNDETTIKFELPGDDQVTLEVYNTTGARIQKTSPIPFRAGVNEFDLEGYDLASGVYIYRLITSNAVDTGRFTLVR